MYFVPPTLPQGNTFTISERDVVLAPSFANLERSRGEYALFARIQAQHHLSQADLIPAACIF
jgi:hypothetical protein